MAIAVAPERLQSFFAADPAALGDPWRVWQEVRDAGPVVEVRVVHDKRDQAHHSSYMLTRYSEVRSALRDADHFSNDTFTRGANLAQLRQVLEGEMLDAFEEMWRLRSLLMTDRDDPEHARLRRIVHRVFVPRRISELSDAADRHVNQLLTELASQGSVVDLTELAYQVPLVIISELLGVPREDADEIKQWSDRFVQNSQTGDERIVIAVDALKHLMAYIDVMIERHRSGEIRSELISVLLEAEDDEVLTREEFASSFFLFLLAGHETTTNLMANGTHELVMRPDLRQALREDPDVIPQATDELLRYVSPVQWLKRRVTEDIVIAGHDLPADSHVLTGLASANHDPEFFGKPDEIDFMRSNAAQHVSLGYGIHFCLGATLARIEGGTLFGTLSRRFPELEVATDKFEFVGPAQTRRLKSLPVRLGPEATAA